MSNAGQKIIQNAVDIIGSVARKTVNTVTSTVKNLDLAAATSGVRNLDLAVLRKAIEVSIKDTVASASFKIKDAIKVILFRLLKIWLVWFGISILLVFFIGGWQPWLIIVLSFIALAIYSVISAIIKLKNSSINIAMEIPYELVSRIFTSLTTIVPALVEDNTAIKLEMINRISNKVKVILKNPISLLYNPNQVVVLSQEIFDIVKDMMTRTGLYFSENMNR